MVSAADNSEWSTAVSFFTFTLHVAQEIERERELLIKEWNYVTVFVGVEILSAFFEFEEGLFLSNFQETI